MVASNSWGMKKIYSYEASCLLAKQVPVPGANFRDMLLETVEPAKPPPAKKKRPCGTHKHTQPAESQRARSRDVLLKELTGIASEVIGTTVSADAPLMESGLDSISGAELLTQMSKHLDMELPQTLLFDHPTLESVADFLALENDLIAVESPEADLPGEYSTDEEATREAPKGLWDLYSELKQEKTDKFFVPTAAKSVRRVVILFAFAGSGSRHILLSLSAHQHLCVCEDLCLMPFKTLAERHSSICSTENFQDGLLNTIQALRNCKISNKTDLFGSVANTYRALQEWCAPRILVDGTESYSAVPEWSLVETKNVFLDPDFVHLLRNPRGCLRNAQGSGDTVELEKQWVNFTKSMLQSEERDRLEIRYEDLKSATSAICSHLSIPDHRLSVDSLHELDLAYEGPL